MTRDSVFISRSFRSARRFAVTVACGLVCAAALTSIGDAAPADASKAKDEKVKRDGGGLMINEGRAERLAGQGYSSGSAGSSSDCAGVDLVVKKVTMQRTGATGIAVSATVANRCTGETEASADWSAKSNADDITVYQGCLGPGVGKESWETGTLVLAGKPLDQSVVITAEIDPRDTIHETNERNNTCVATLPAAVNRRIHTCR